MSSNHVAAVLAYNRRDLTLACPRSLRAQNVPDLVVDAYVLDDAIRLRALGLCCRPFGLAGSWHGGAVTALHASVGFPGAALSTWRVR